MLNLINDILDLSKIEANNLNVEIVKVSLLELIADVESMFENELKEKNLEFIINYHYFINGTILSGHVALLTLYCHQEKEELLI